jgi:hypothetical protein
MLWMTSLRENKYRRWSRQQVQLNSWEKVLVALTRKDEWRLRDDGWLSAGEVVIPFHVDLYNAAPNVKDDREKYSQFFRFFRITAVKETTW